MVTQNALTDQRLRFEPDEIGAHQIGPVAPRKSPAASKAGTSTAEA